MKPFITVQIKNEIGSKELQRKRINIKEVKLMAKDVICLNHYQLLSLTTLSGLKF